MKRSRVIAAVTAMLTAMLLQATLVAPLTLPVPVSLPAVTVVAIALVDGPGAGMAVEDAEALARHLNGDRPPAEALAAYVRERRARTRRVQAWAQRNGAVFHLPTPVRRAAFAMARRGVAGDLGWLYGYRPPA